MDMLRTQFIAQEILARVNNTQAGHCARVNFLDRAEAMHIYNYMAEQQLGKDITIRILSNEATHGQHQAYVTTDKAIEIRNRKQERLCLFVPSDVIDAAYSSIANSFALIDGRELHTRILKRITNQITHHYPEAGAAIRAIFSHLRGITGISDERKLDFVTTALEHAQNHEAQAIGRELWRVNLITDADENFISRLDSNRTCTLLLINPNKLGATAYERIQSLKVDTSTASALGLFFHGRAMNDIQTWSRALASEPGLTFDRWIFLQADKSDIRSVTIDKFAKANGEVEQYCKLRQPDGRKGGLLARYGVKDTLVVRWKCEPEKPNNLHNWRIGIVPSGSEYGFDDCLDERNIAGKYRRTTIKLDMDFDEPPDYTVCVRIVPLNTDGSEICDESTGEVIYSDSEEFFLVKDIEDRPNEPLVKDRLQTVPSIAFGRLSLAVEMSEKDLRNSGNQIKEEVTQKGLKDSIKYFSLRINERHVLSVGLSDTLAQLERRVLASPRTGGSFEIRLDEVRSIDVNKIDSYALEFGDAEAWAPFWRQRDSFFKQLRASEPRDLVETADWTPELADKALRYASAYQTLVNTLIEQHADPNEIRTALSIDSLIIKVAVYSNQPEEALVILPTHPLRIAWYACYAQLLRIWEQRLTELPTKERKRGIDLQALRLLVPINVPAFAYHACNTTTFTFFQNLRFFHGIALPVDVADPNRRYSDIAGMLGMPIDEEGIGDIQPDNLARHLQAFQEMHPYANTLVTTLINPDRGNLFAGAVHKLLLNGTSESDGEDTIRHAPLFQIISYSEDTQANSLQALGQIRQQQIDQQSGQNSDYFLPGLIIVSRPMQQLDQIGPPEAHLAVVSDFTRPAIVAIPMIAGGETSSFSLYGLINRFISQFTADEQVLRWHHRIITGGIKKPEPHPAGARYNDTLIGLHTAWLKAGGYLLNGADSQAQPVLEVKLETQQRELLERLHIQTNWVITLDRFFTLDYYDSPNTPGLAEVARKYVLDYSPEFTEGLGHRMMVTTAWHEEIGSMLSQAMDELGFANIDESVSHLLHFLKTISGRLVLQALESTTSAAAAVGLGAVAAWLERQGRLKKAVLIPVDTYPRIFTRNGTGKPAYGERRCDLALISLRRNIVDVIFIEVKWRRTRTPLEAIAQDMIQQMKASETAMRERFFNEGQIDGALQRSYLANVLRFYFERSRRYGLFDPKAEETFLERISELEKTKLDLRASYEGYVVSLNEEPREPLSIDDAKITLLTINDFMHIAELVSSSDINEPISTDSTKQEQDIFQEGRNVEHEIEKANVEHVVSNHKYREPANQKSEQISIALGEAKTGEPIVWQPGIAGSPHLSILGIPGQGKSWAIIRIAAELDKQHIPALVLDFHGSFANPQEAYVNTVHPTIFDAAKGLPFSPFECTHANGVGGWKANAMAVAEIFGYVAGMGDMQQDIVFTAIEDAYRARGFHEDTTDEEIQELGYPTPAEVLKRIEQNEQKRRTSNVAARCRRLLGMDLFRPEEGIPNHFSLTQNGGLVVDLSGQYSEELQLAAGSFLLRKLYKDMFHWGPADRLRLAIVLDEAHRLAKDVTLPKIMKEGRKFGIAVIVASQGLNDFHPDIINNVGSKIIFRMNPPESKKAAGLIRGHYGEDVIAHIEKLTVGNAYVQTPEMDTAKEVEMYPLE